MHDNTEYQIFIGCHDSQLGDELVSRDELKDMVIQFFKQKKIDFSMLSARGGYISENGGFVSENSLCINIIGAYDLDIIRLARSLSMFMNQECSLVVKSAVRADFR